MAKALAKIGETPDDLGMFVTRRSEGKDGVVISVGERIADAIAPTMRRSDSMIRR